VFDNESWLMVGLFEPPEVAEDRRKKKTKRVSHRHLFRFPVFLDTKAIVPLVVSIPLAGLSESLLSHC
jgi:hypothetical protein